MNFSYFERAELSRNHITDSFNQFARKLHNDTLCVPKDKLMAIAVLLYVVMVLLFLNRSEFI